MKANIVLPSPEDNDEDEDEEEEEVQEEVEPGSRKKKKKPEWKWKPLRDTHSQGQLVYPIFQVGDRGYSVKSNRLTYATRI